MSIKDICTIMERHPRLADEEWFRHYLGIQCETPGTIISRYQEKEHRLIMVSGCDMDKLIELFAAGWTLQPPTYERKPLTMVEFSKGEGK